MLTAKPRLPIREMVLIGLWPSPIKKLFYRLKGYRIGKGVSLGLGSVVSGEEVEIGDRTSIGFGTSIRGKTIRIGPHVQVGAMTLMDTPHIEIGEGTKINEQVFVGGLQFPDSRLVVGRNCQIMQMTFINPCRSVIIGDDTGIGGDCLIFGHTSWLSKFEGYPVDFNDVTIGSSVSVAWRVFVVAGARIGDGAVIGANSLVNGRIPPRCLAVGSPARVAARAPYFPRAVTEAQKAEYLREIVEEMMGYLGASGFPCRRQDSVIEVIQHRRAWWGGASQKTWRLWVAEEELSLPDLGKLPGELDVALSLRKLNPEVRRALETSGLLWFDLESKERASRENDLGEEVALYLRRYGVRFLRVC